MEAVKVTFENLPELTGRLYSEVMELRKQLTQRLPEPPRPKEKLTSKEALEFMASEGYPITERTLNKKCSLGEIQYEIIGSRRVFTRSVLKQWIEEGCPNVSQMKAIDKIANTLNYHK